MSSTQGYYYPTSYQHAQYPAYPSYPSSSQPINMPQKPGYYPAYPQQQAYGYGRMSVSPPEGSESATSGGPSYDPSGTASSYAASASEYEGSSVGSAGSVDLLDYMSDRLNGAFDPIPLDRSLVTQTQTSGELNAKTRQLMELQALANSRLAGLRTSFEQGMKTAKEVQHDLEWTQKKVSSINKRAAQKYPKEHRMASERYPAPVDY